MNGKDVIEDCGIGYGRTRDWPAIPEGLYRRTAVSDSTTIMCVKCGSPWGGLIYDSETEMFRHRKPCRRQSSV